MKLMENNITGRGQKSLNSYFQDQIRLAYVLRTLKSACKS